MACCTDVLLADRSIFDRPLLLLAGHTEQLLLFLRRGSRALGREDRDDDNDRGNERFASH